MECILGEIGYGFSWVHRVVERCDSVVDRLFAALFEVYEGSDVIEGDLPSDARISSN